LKHSQQSGQSFGIASPEPLLFASKPQETIHKSAIQVQNIDLLFLKPSAEIRNDDDLLSGRVASIALLNQTGRKIVKVVTQRPLPESFNSA
jgi:hypothetical protein